jgi:hypothetical protein
MSVKYEKSILPHGRLVFLANERKSSFGVYFWDDHEGSLNERFRTVGPRPARHTHKELDHAA